MLQVLLGLSFLPNHLLTSNFNKTNWFKKLQVKGIAGGPAPIKFPTSVQRIHTTGYIPY